MKLLFPLLVVLSLFGSCTPKKESPDFSFITTYAVEQTEEAIAALEKLKQNLDSPKEAKDLFDQARDAYKRAEPFLTYVNDDFAHRVNGAALPIFLEDNGRVLQPTGLQAIEEQVYVRVEDKELLTYQIDITIGFLKNLQKDVAAVPFIPKRFFTALHYQYLRILSLGISGFDTPTSHRALHEAIVSLQSINGVYNNCLSRYMRTLDPELDKQYTMATEKAIGYLNEHSDFDSFDRYEFIRNYFNEVTAAWVMIRKRSGLYDDEKMMAVNMDAPTFFEQNSFNENIFRSASNRNPSDKQIALGKKLFFDTRLSTTGNLACVSCHIPQHAYADTLIFSNDKNSHAVKRNTPSLINAIYQRSFFWDGRSDNMESQITNVFVNENEFSSTVHKISTAILEDSAYQHAFAKAYGSVREDNIDIIKALASYVSTLNAMNSSFDQAMRLGSKVSLTPEQIHGFNLFMGKALCGTCHFAPLFNGTVPPFYNETEKEVLGTPASNNNLMLDDDPGFYIMYGSPIHKNMFKTPSVRNAELTAPFMHNGAYNTLEEVVDFYRRGGGTGLGFTVDNQTLPFDSLSLDAREQKALVAFMKTLSDTVVVY